MENLSLIAAVGENGELGYNNSLIWRIREDLQFYKEMTMGKKIIMGRKTLESMPLKALEGREPIVLTSKSLENRTNLEVYHDLDSLLNYISETNTEFMVVGGSKVYEQLLPYVQIMYLTEIKREAYADSFFPYFDKEEWNITEIGDFLDNNVPYVRNKYVRKRSKIRQWEN